MIKVNRTPTPPASLAIEKKKSNGSYKKPDVVEQLASDFHDKCYLCEMNELQSIEVEHLRPHENGKYLDLKFDWNNLFYSCAHCNSVKNRGNYKKDVLDCCVSDPEEYVTQELIDGKVRVTAIKPSIVAKTTASLIQDCFELKNTAIRIKECQTKIKALQKVMTRLYRLLEEYEAQETLVAQRALRGMLKKSYNFSGFTRTYVRLHKEQYSKSYLLL